ncbi:DUF5602 domain-containing protein [Halomicrobium salinisoli]|uniref:DUF5602 domain-containing protein n=1 Tax=Halomicrobium salinisoli TaxID=2878391 RepID=UPI001CF02F5E|nr:DUF5602 domain-containing protein [Halomicrobium salinisoli]
MTDGSRRSFLRGISAATAGSIALSAPVTATGSETGSDAGAGDGSSATVERVSVGEVRRIGEGQISTFASMTASGEPTRVGVHFSPGALAGLPRAAAFERGDVDGKRLHGFWSLPLPLALPDAAPPPFAFVGAAWNPGGHTPEGVYDRPHFDLHFYFREPEVIGDIESGVVESLSPETVPEGYELIEGGAVVPGMGAHLAPADAPEFDDEEWHETLIWGVADVDGGDARELHFVEPMVTVDFLETHLDGVHSEPVAQPAVYPQDGCYPTTYTVRDLGDAGYAVAMADFEERSA